MDPNEVYDPPAWAVKFLSWFCPDALLEGILGDLLEEFDNNVNNNGLNAARRRFIYSVFRFLHPSIILKNRKVTKLINMGMLKSHLKVAYRGMWKYRFYSFANLLGLTVAFAFLLLTSTFIYHENSYDQFHQKKDQIFRLAHEVLLKETGESLSKSAVTPVPLSKDLQQEVAAVTKQSRVGSASMTLVKDNIPYEEVIVFVDPDFLGFFDFPMDQGLPKAALIDQSSMVLSAEKAQKYFGYSDPIGQTLSLNVNDSLINFQVTGVIDAKEKESSISVPILVNFEKFELLVGKQAMTSYNYSAVENYIYVETPQDISLLEGSMTEAMKKFSRGDDTEVKIYAQPLASIHLEEDVTGTADYTTSRKIQIMAGLGFLVLIIAIINYIMLSTGHSLNRLKELGLRKSLGAFKSQLRIQLIYESFFITILSGTLGYVLALLLIPLFNNLIDSNLSLGISAVQILVMFLISILIALVSGGIQAVILLKHKLVAALKGNSAIKNKDSILNQGLVVLQFAFSMILISGTLVMRSQLNYIQDKNLGFDEDRLVELTLGNTESPEVATRLVDRFRNEALSNSQISSVSASMNNASEPWTTLGFLQENGDTENIHYNQIDPDYLKTMGIELTMGADYNPNSGNSANDILVNESLVKHFGWDDPLNQQIPGKNFDSKHRIIGVMKDFHFSSLHNEIEPLILSVNQGAVSSGVTGLSTYYWPPNLYRVIVKIGPGELTPAVNFLEDTWKSTIPNKQFQYRFVDESLDQQYAEEKRWRKVINAASIFALGIAWLGLLGLTRLSVQRRTKEIGVRKVLGSSIPDVIILLSKRFLILVSVAVVIGVPIAWLALDNWLQSYPYRIELNPLLFILAAIIVLIVSIGSVSLQSLKAANANPVDSLKCE